MSDEDQLKDLVPSLEFDCFPLILILHLKNIRPMFSVSPLSVFVKPASHPTKAASFRRPLALTALSCSLVIGSLALATESAIANPTPSPLADGIYVFGESSTPAQIGTTYMVMQISHQEINGGFYQPASSFDCFHGEASGSEIALTVTDSYAQTEHPFAMTLENATTVASANAAASQWVPTGFYRLADLTETDQEVLQICSSR